MDGIADLVNGLVQTYRSISDEQRVSLKEKLAAYKAQVSGAGRADTEKAKRREKTL